jgi:hypothetical protein
MPDLPCLLCGTPGQPEEGADQFVCRACLEKLADSLNEAGALEATA